jgi:hypothetical protein
MYIIKHRSRRSADGNRAMWVVSGTVWCNSIEQAVDMLLELQATKVWNTVLQ